MQKNGTLNLISTWRGYIMGFAALWIWVNHEWIPVVDWVHGLGDVEFFLKRIGFVGVDFFLFLSGMGLVYAIERYSTPVFYGRRFARILPPFLLFGLVMMFSEHWTLGTYLKNVTGFNFFALNIYSYLWFVPAISFLYLVFPLFYRFFRRGRGKPVLIFGTLLVWAMLSILAEGKLREDLYGFTNRIPVFLMGVLAGWYARERDVTFTGETWTVCALTLLLGLLLAYETNYQGMSLLVPVSNCCVPDLLIAVSGTFLLAKLFSILGGLNSRIIRIILEIFKFYGSISLEFYCVQEWMGTVLNPHLTAWLRDPLVDVVNLLACTLAAVLLAQVCGGLKWLAARKRKMADGVM